MKNLKGEIYLNLDIFNKIIDSAKENSTVQSFIKELSEFLDNKNSEIGKTDKKIEDVQENLITRYRDKMKLERYDILSDYAKKTANQGAMYYIFSKNSINEDEYNLAICEEGKSHEILTVNKNELPKDASVNTVLRKYDGEFILDEKTTKSVQAEINNMINNLLKEQNQYLNNLRIEGHVYEVIEVSSNKVTLLDRTKNDRNSFEEIEFSKENLDKAVPGAKFEYINGEYYYIEKNV